MDFTFRIFAYRFCHCEEGACARRGNLKRCDLSSRNELWLSGTKQNLKIKKVEAKRRSESMFFAIGISSCFVLPCFVTGCHAFGFKIATAALRPRNDTKLERFCLENRRFSFLAVIFCAVLLCIVFQTFHSKNCPVFPQNLPN